VDAGGSALRLLGLAARAGRVVPGTERVREAVRAGGVQFVVVAADASAGAMDKLLPLLERRGVAHAVDFDRAALGGAVGRAPLSAVGVSDASLARRLRELLAGGG
jgi:ribosomal protein L7Ae-like RNA K-turn-binding protein